MYAWEEGLTGVMRRWNVRRRDGRSFTAVRASQSPRHIKTIQRHACKQSQNAYGAKVVVEELVAETQAVEVLVEETPAAIMLAVETPVEDTQAAEQWEEVSPVEVSLVEVSPAEEVSLVEVSPVEEVSQVEVSLELSWLVQQRPAG